MEKQKKIQLLANYCEKDIEIIKKSIKICENEFEQNNLLDVLFGIAYIPNGLEQAEDLTKELEPILYKFPIDLKGYLRYTTPNIIGFATIPTIIKIMDSDKTNNIVKLSQIIQYNYPEINIVPIYHYDPTQIILTNPETMEKESKNGGYYIERYIAGYTLEELPIQYAKNAILMAINQLEKIHKIGILHGDTHWGNFIYNVMEHKIYVTDFENAKTLNNSNQFQFLPIYHAFYNIDDEIWKFIKSFKAYIAAVNFASYDPTIPLYKYYNSKRGLSLEYYKIADKLSKNSTLNDLKEVVYML
jgi:predicted Ser/Thr protein kinase